MVERVGPRAATTSLSMSKVGCSVGSSWRHVR
eukprot:CAMPEP_0206252428 /NCGR_PEP_ID=MMETSP0047_2-20121206/22584_1 /ASSEMBLY_ACC=CAM_ASM_000192 /TAXON_ID=195065 /ORGANISM="Chroomonas mesostigmatica_cf, Strain CCMP1168" /LENGTH=31 /DNA_ID= /DNA_START= /DNA_END= /DNA_ORIENTATION=